MSKGDISASQLLREFAEARLSVNREMAEEIIRREDAADCIFELLKDERYWNDIDDGWFPIHAIFLLALIRTRKAFEVFRWILENKAEEREDWLPEDVPSLLFHFGKFGKEFFKEIKELTLNRDLNIYVRLSAADALCAMAITDESVKIKVTEICKNLLNEHDEEFVSLLLPVVAEIKDEELFTLVKRKFRKLDFAKKVTDMSDLIKLHKGKSKHPEYVKCLRDPREHFSEENLRRLREYNYG